MAPGIPSILTSHPRGGFTVQVPIFRDAELRGADLGLVRDVVRALAAWNREYLTVYPAPRLYTGGVVYRPERGTELWRVAPYVLADGHGDCEDLAAFRLAELGIEGDDRADVDLVSLDRWPGPPDLHVRCMTAGGVEDPSAELVRRERERGER